MSVAKGQNCSINFLRFLFTFGICFMHLVCQVISPYIAYPLNYGNFAAPSYAVELFFIMAGFFLFFNKKPLEEYISNRIIRLWPLLVFSTIIAGILRALHISGMSLKFDDILNCLFLQGTGLMQGGATNGPAWFVGVLFWVSVIYYYCKRVLGKKSFIALMIVMAGIGLIVFGTTGKANPFEGVRGFILPAWGGGGISMMMLRGFTAIGIGCILGKFQEIFAGSHAAQTLQSVSGSKKLFTALEVIFFVGLCAVLLGGSLMNIYSSYLLAMGLFLIVFFLFFNNLGYFSSKVLNRKVFNLLGAYSYAIYIMQNVVFYIVDYCLKTYENLIPHTNLVITISMILFIVIGIISYYLVNFIVEKTVQLYNFIQRDNILKETTL